jgi:hypothetical protein
LFLALELGESTWKLAFTTGLAQKPHERTIAARDRKALLEEIAHAKRRFGLAARTRVASCYEAGREGFWLHRFLIAEGIENRVVDAASIEVSRRSRHVKTDRMDVHRLLRLLGREALGEEHVWAVVRVPTPEDEDRRHLHRALLTAKRDRTRTTNRIQGLLANHKQVGSLAGLRIEGRSGCEPRRQTRSPDGAERGTLHVESELDSSVLIEGSGEGRCGIRSRSLTARLPSTSTSSWLTPSAGQRMSPPTQRGGPWQVRYSRPSPRHAIAALAWRGLWETGPSSSISRTLRLPPISKAKGLVIS